MNTPTQNKELMQYTIDKLEDLKSSYTGYGCDLHNELFNTDYFIIGYYEAEQWLINNVGIFEAIRVVSEYEKSNFGEINPEDISNSEKLVNMYTYIIGEQILNNSDTLQQNWDNRLYPETIQAIIDELS